MAINYYLSVGDGATSDYLNLRDNTKHFVATLERPEPGRIVLGLHIVGSSPDDMVNNFRNIQRKLLQAQEAAGGLVGTWVTLGVQRNTTTMVYFDILRGQLVEGRVYAGQTKMDATLVLETLPWSRGAALTPVSTGSLTASSPSYLLQDVPGDLDALVQLRIDDGSSAGVLNRIRVARRAADTIAAVGDFDPWVDVTNISPATTGTDATFGTVGANYAVRTVSATTFADLADASMPAGVLNKGVRFDIFGRLLDTATAQAAPTGPSASVTEPTLESSETALVPLPVSVRGIGSGRATSGTSVTGAYDVNTLDGSLLVALVIKQVASGSIATAPANWSWLSPEFSITSEGGNEVYGRWAYRRDASVVSSTGAFTGLPTATATDPHTILTWEILNGNAITQFATGGSTTDTNDITMGTPAVASVPGEVILAAAALQGADTTDQTDFWMNGYDTAGAANNLVSGLSLAQNIGGAFAAPRVRTLATELSHIYGFVGILPHVSSVTTTVYAQPSPGDLAPGTYDLRVQAVGPGERAGGVLAFTDQVVTTQGSAIEMSWSAPTGTVLYYRITVQLGTRFYVINTDDNATSYTLTTLEGADYASALPTTADTPLPGYLQLQLSTPNGLMRELPEVQLTGANAWRSPRLASAIDLPPIDPLLDGTLPDWKLKALIRSSNGLNTTVQLDALFLASHDEPRMRFEYPGMTLATTALRWLGQTDRRARSMNGWLRTAADVEQGPIKLVGCFTVRPGDNILTFLLEQAAGLSRLTNVSITVQITVYPRYLWQRGV